MATQKEMREAYKRGRRDERTPWSTTDEEYLEHAARVAYPPKPMTVPRILIRKENRFRFVNDRLEYTGLVHEQWRPLCDNDFHRQILDLMLNPTKVVEGED